jgi:hypothetical protein
LYSTISIEVDEFKFFKIIRNVLARSSESLVDLNIDGDDDETEDRSEKSSETSGTELSWLISVDLYEMLDAIGRESIGFREFCTLMYLVAGAQSN